MTVRDRNLRIDEVEARVGYSRGHLYKLMQTGEFPRPTPIGKRAVRWSEQEIEAYLQAQRQQPRQPVSVPRRRAS